MVDVKKIKQLLDRHFTIHGSATISPHTGIVDATGIVSLKEYGNSQGETLTQMPVQFGHVDGDFWCELKDLTTLKGAPKYVDGDFRCSGNKLTTLEGAPSFVGGTFRCSTNRLTSLVGAPKRVMKDFYCPNNQLKDLQGAPAHVGRVFTCQYNPLESLRGIPDLIGEEISLTYSSTLPLLRTLVAPSVFLSGAPDEITFILNDPKFSGKGKAVALACAAEMIKEGFKGNAGW